MAEVPMIGSVFSFPKLNGENWRQWRYNMEMLLCHEGLYGFIDGTEVSPIKVTKTDGTPGDESASSKDIVNFNRRKQKAVSTIAMSIEPEQQNLIMGIHDPKEMWDMLKAAFEPASRARIAHLRAEFMKIKFEDSESMAVFLGRLKQARDRLDAVGKKIDDDELAYQMLMNLPPKYGNVAQQLYMLKDEEFTSTKVKERLLSEYDRLKYQKCDLEEVATSSRSENVMLMKKSKNRFRNQKAKVAEPVLPKETRRCYRCGIIGHLSPQCKDQKKNLGKSKSNSSFYAESEKQVNFLSDSTSIDWIVDSGSSNHFISDKSLLRNFKQCDINVKGIGNNSVKAKGYGTISLSLNVKGREEILTLLKVYWGPSLKKNLISGSQVDKHGHRLIICDSECTLINSNGRTMGIAPLVGSLYILHAKVVPELSSANISISKLKNVRNDIMMWHRRFGHQNVKGLKHLAKENLVYGVNRLSGDAQLCDPCIRGKMTRAQFKSVGGIKSKHPLELIHLDLWSSASGPSYGQAKYLLTAVDDFSRYAWGFPLKNKNDCFAKFKNFKTQVEKQVSRPIKAVRTDCGLEFCSDEFKQFLEKDGIVAERTNVYSPEMNGVAERLNRTIANGIRAIRLEADLPKGLWAELALAFIYLHNRFPHRSINNQIPFSLFFDRKCSVRHLKVIGSLAYVHVERNKRDKLDPKTKEGVLVGYAFETVGYRIWLPKERKVIETKHVKFNELVKGYTRNELSLCPTSDYVPVIEEETNELPQSSSPTPEVVAVERKHCRDIPWRREVTQRKSGRSKGRFDVYYYPPNSKTRLISLKGAQKYCNSNNIEFDKEAFDFRPHPESETSPQSANEGTDSSNDESSFLCIVEPSSYEEATSVPEAVHWKCAMNEELNTLKVRDVYDIVPRPAGKRIIGSRWVYKLKESDHKAVKKFRARLVAQGFRQIKGLDYNEIFSPVVNYEVIYFFISFLVLSLKWFHKHLDVKCAYLYGNLDEEHFMETPKGFNFPDGITKQNHVLKLKRAIYGLHQASRQWHSELETTLLNLGFSSFSKTNCVYHLNCNTIILVYVDDLIVFSRTESEMAKITKLLQSKFEIKDLGKIRKVLGIEFKDSKDNWVIHQKSYIERLKENFKEIPYVKCKLPMSPGQVVQSGCNEQSMEGEVPYRNLIGSLLFLATRSRPDILFAVTMLAQYNSHPTLTHWKLLCQVFNYVISTVNYCIPMLVDDMKHFTAYTDASWASDRDDRRSFSGFIIFFKNVPISWRTRKQKCVALSTMESEYIAISESIKELLWLHNIYDECSTLLKVTVQKPLMFSDSESAIYYCKNFIENVRNKHIDIRFHYVKQLLADGLFRLLKVPGNWNIADLLTKPVTFDKLSRYCEHIFR